MKSIAQELRFVSIFRKVSTEFGNDSQKIWLSICMCCFVVGAKDRCGAKCATCRVSKERGFERAQLDNNRYTRQQWSNERQ